MADEIKKLDKITDLEHDAVQFVISQRDSAENEISVLQPRWDRCYKMWLRFRKAPDTGRVRKSNLFTPLVFNIIQTVTPLIVLAIISVRHFLHVEPVGDEDEAGATKIFNLLAYQFPRIPDWFHTLVSWIKSCFLYGTAIISPGWIDDTVEQKVFENRQVLGRSVARVPVMEDVPVTDPETGEVIIGEDGQPAMTQRQKTRRVGYYGPSLTHIPLDNFRKDPAAKTLRQARWAYDDKEISEYDIRAARIPGTDKPFYRNLNLIKDIAPISGAAKANATKQAARGGSGSDSSPDTFCRMHTIQNYWGVMPQKYLFLGNESELGGMSDEEKEKPIKGHLVILDDQLPILSRLNDADLYFGDKPYIAIVDVMDLESFYGLGEAYPVEDHQHEHNNCRNQWLTASRRDLNRRKYVDRRADIDVNAMKYGGDGAIIMMDGVGSVVEEKSSFNYEAAMLRDRIIKEEVTEISSMYPQVGAAGPEAGIKATIYASFERTLLKKFSFKARFIEEMGIKEIGRWMMLLNSLYLTEDYSFRILDESFVVTPDDMQRQYDYYAVGSASEPFSSKEARKAGVERVFSMIINSPYADKLNMDAWMKELCEVNGIQGWQEKFANPVEMYHQQLMQHIAQAVEAGIRPEQILEGFINEENDFGKPETFTQGTPRRTQASQEAGPANGLDDTVAPVVKGIIRKFGVERATGGQ